MSAHPSFGPARKACNRCRLQKRKCNTAQPACSLCTRLGQRCIYAKSNLTDEVSRETPDLEVLTPPGIKTQIIAKLINSNPGEIIARYHETIHPWFSIFSESTLSQEHPVTWETVSVEFALLCFAIILLDSAPQESQGIHILNSEQQSMYRRSKAWISLLEVDGLNSIELVKARLLINIFEVSHGLYPAAYLSIAATVRAADALAVFQPPGASQSFTQNVRDEYRIMWCGIAIIDRYIAIEKGQWPPVTRDRPIPPASLTCTPLCLLEEFPTSFTRLFESSTLLDHVHKAIYQPMSQEISNTEEMTLMIRTLRSFEIVAGQTIPEQSRLISSCLALLRIALLLVLNNESKKIPSDETTTSSSLNALIGDTVRIFEVLHEDNLAADQPTIPPLAIFLIYKSAEITTTKLQSGIEPGVNLQRLKSLRNTLKVIAKRWLAGESYLNLLDQDTTPRILAALRG